MKVTTAPEIGKYYLVWYDGRHQPAVAIELYGYVYFQFTSGESLYWMGFDDKNFIPIPPPIQPEHAAVNVANAVRRAMQEAMLKLPAFLHDPDDIHTGGRVLEWLMPDVVEAARAAALEAFSNKTTD